MHKPPNTKRYTIGEDDGSNSVERNAYESSYLFSECRPVKELLPLWKRFKKFHKIRTFEEWLLERNKCRKDNYYLGIVLGHDFVEHVHREMCQQFVPKMFDGVYHAGYTLREVRKAIEKHQLIRGGQEMMLLAPRGSFKSTTNKVDCVSWMLNAPDVRILILCGETGLANKFMDDIKGYFHMPERADPTRFQQLFPEYILAERDATDTLPISCAARIIPQGGDPTLWVNSVGSNLSGWHCDILKGDDVVTDENSNTEGTREKVNFKWSGALNLLDEWGFCDNIGTRYFPDDLFGDRIKLATSDDPLPLKLLVRAAWMVKPAFARDPSTGKAYRIEDLKEHMVDLYFPEKLDFKSIHSKLLRNKIQALCQQFNEPAGGDDLLHFDEDELRKAHEQLTAAPINDKRGVRQDIYVAFDHSSGSKSGDYSAGAACVFDKRDDGESVMHVIDVAFGKWKNSELARQIVEMGAKWNPRCILIEDWAESELIKIEIARLAMARGIVLPLLWVKRSMEFNAKKNRISGIEILLTTARIKFVGGWWTDELIKQFTKYTGDRVRRRHDDIPDAIGYLQKFMPETTDTSAYEAMKKAEEERQKTTQFASHVFNNPVWANEQAQKHMTATEEKPLTNSIDEQFFGGQGIY